MATKKRKPKKRKTPRKKSRRTAKKPASRPKAVRISMGPKRKPIKFTRGGLHRSLNVPTGKTIPASKMRAALAGRYGPKAKKQAQLAAGGLATMRKKRKAK